MVMGLAEKLDDDYMQPIEITICSFKGKLSESEIDQVCGTRECIWFDNCKIT
jgi:hypothetical protein